MYVSANELALGVLQAEEAEVMAPAAAGLFLDVLRRVAPLVPVDAESESRCCRA
jgi:hypothetical protein